MATEREQLRELTKALKNLDHVYWHKLGDTFGGHRQPFDAFAFFCSIGFTFEAKKSRKGGLAAHQIRHLTQSCIKGGAFSFVIYFQDRNPVFVPYISGVYYDVCSYTLIRERPNVYADIDNLFTNLLNRFKNALSNHLNIPLDG